MQNSADKKVYVTLLALVLAWGLAWPISKVGLEYMSPIWYSAGRFFFGILATLTYLAASKQIRLPKRKDFTQIVSIGLFQMALFLMLMNYGLYHVGAGRASILVYSTPIWVTPIAILFFKEKLNAFKVTGLLLGVAGLITLLSPWGFDWTNPNVVTGNLLLASAAIVWAGVMLNTRYGTWHSEPIALLLWQMLLGGAVTFFCALMVEPSPQISWNPMLVGTLLYNGLAATAFGYWASIFVSKSLPVVTTSICFLGVPVVGLVSSVIFLGEELTLSLVLALCLIVSGLALMTKGSAPRS